MKIKQKEYSKKRIAQIDVNKLVKIFETEYDREFQRKVKEILTLQRKISIVYFCLGVTFTLMTVNILMLLGLL